MSRGPWIDHFSDNFLWSNATLILKGMAPYGVVALEEIDRVCEKLRPRQGEPDRAKSSLIPAHSRPKDGVLSPAYAGIQQQNFQAW